MINYKYNSLFDESSTQYNLVLTSDDNSIRIDYSNMTDAWELNEGLIDSAKFTIGQCLTSRLTVHIINNGTSYLGVVFDVNLILNNHTDSPFYMSKFRVAEETLEDDRRKKKLVLYDAMYEVFKADMTDWYNSLTFPITLKNFRNSFFDYFGIEQASTGTNENMQIYKKTIDGVLTGKEVIESICEIKGCFGHIGRDAKFKYYLPTISVQKSFNQYKSLKYESYTVQPISKLKVSFENISGQYGDDGNVYVLQHDLLLIGNIGTTLSGILQNMLPNAKRCTFVPAEIEMNAHPYMTIGDRITIRHRSGDVIDTIIMNRTIKGVQSLTDKIEAKGDEYRADTKSIRQQVQQTAQRVGAIEADNVTIHGSINAQSGKIDDLYANKLSTADLSAQVATLGYATVGQLNAANARIDGKLSTNELSSAITNISMVTIGGSLTIGNYLAQWKTITVKGSDGKDVTISYLGHA